MTITHPVFADFWRHVPPTSGPCWVCGENTEWIYLDIAYQHLDCDRYPTEDGEDGEVLIIRGLRQFEEARRERG